MLGDSTAVAMTRDQKRAHFAPLMALNRRHKKIKKEPVTELVGALGDRAIVGGIKNGVYNRGKDFNGQEDENGIWSADKKQDFIVRVIGGTAPLTFLFRESEDDEETGEEQHMQTYDGANRILAIAEFLSDKLRIRYNGVTFLYSELPETTKNAFRNQKCISLTMSDCPEDFATQYAADLNHGTPMSMGEHLNLLRTQTFPLCRHFDKYAKQYTWSTRGCLGHRSSGIKLIALVIMHIEQNQSDWVEHQTAAVNKFFSTAEAVKNSTETDAVLQSLDAVVRQWQAQDFKISKKDLPKYIQILAAACILFSFHRLHMDQSMLDKLDGLTSEIKKYSPGKLVAAYMYVQPPDAPPANETVLAVAEV
jgi:hypothetical protein